ncbi:MAG: methyltransferase [Cellvibrionales bacterium]|nr:methyltransferase [Cellvibrionales bacterium]
MATPSEIIVRDKAQSVDLMMSFFKAKTFTAALELRLFDHLSDQPVSLEALSKTTDIPYITLERLIIALVSLGYVNKTAEGFTLYPEQADFLQSDKKGWLGWLGSHVDKFLYPLWSNLAPAVKEDTDQRLAIFGDDRSWFDILYQNPEDVSDFQEFLGQLAQPFIEGFVSGYDFGQHKHFLDIGSGIGTLPRAVVDAYPDIKASICELPAAHAFLNDKLAEAGYSDKISVVDGDVIAGDLPSDEYDLVHLGWMLHDYSEELQMKILKNIYDAMPVGGQFIASETPLNNEKTGPEFTALLSLNMLVSTDGGIESTQAEYIARFEQAGFNDVRVLEIDGPRTLFMGVK